MPRFLNGRGSTNTVSLVFLGIGLTLILIGATVMSGGKTLPASAFEIFSLAAEGLKRKASDVGLVLFYTGIWVIFWLTIVPKVYRATAKRRR